MEEALQEALSKHKEYEETIAQLKSTHQDKDLEMENLISLHRKEMSEQQEAAQELQNQLPKAFSDLKHCNSLLNLKKQEVSELQTFCVELKEKEARLHFGLQ